MGGAVGKIHLDLGINQDNFTKQLHGITDLAKKAGTVLAGAFAVKGLVSFSKKCLELGSDLGEVQNVVDVTFTTMSNKVNEFANSAAKNFGLSETMAKQFTGTYGAMAKAFGFTEKSAYNLSTSLTGLAGNVASFYNISQDEAYTKLKSVFTGETESLKDLGVVMTQTALDSFALANGFNKTTKDMGESEKVALRYKFVMDRLSAASGDFIRTSGGWANQVRVLKLQFDSFKANIGQGLINLLTPVIKLLNVLMSKLVMAAQVFKMFTEFITGSKPSGGGISAATKSTDKMAGSMGDAAASSGNIGKNVGKAGKEAKKLAKTLLSVDNLNVLSKQSDSGNSGGDSGSVGGGAVGGAIPAIDMPEGNIKGIGDAAKKLAKNLEKYFKPIKKIFDDFKKGDFFSAARGISKLVAGIFKFFADAIKKVDWKKIGNKIGDFIRGIDWVLILSSIGDLIWQAINAAIELWNGMFEAAPIETAILTAIALLKFTPLGGILLKVLGKGLIRGLAFIAQKLSFKGITTALSKGGGKAITVGKTVAKGLGSALSKGLRGGLNVIRAVSKGIGGALVKGLRVGFSSAKTVVQVLGKGLAKALNIALTLGKTIIKGLSRILIKGIGTVLKAGKLLVGGLSKLLNIGKAAISKLVNKLVFQLIPSFVSAVSEAFASLGGIGGILTTDLATVVGAGTFAEIATVFATGLVGAITAAIGGFSLGEWLNELITGEKIDMSWAEQFNAIKESFSDGTWKQALELWWDDISTAVTKAWEGLSKGASKAWKDLTESAKVTFGNLKSNISDVVTGIKNAWNNAWSAVKTATSEAWGKLKTSASNGINNIKTGIANGWTNIKKGWSAGITALKTGFINGWNNIKKSASAGITNLKTRLTNGVNAIKTAWLDIWGRIKKGTSNIINGMWKGIKGTINGMIGGIEALANGVIKGLNAIIGALNNLKIEIPDWVPGFGGEKFQMNIPKMNPIAIPKLAQGGYVKPNTPQLAMIGDNRHYGEIVSPEDKMYEITLKAMLDAFSKFGQSVKQVQPAGMGDITIPIYLFPNGAKLDEVIVRAQDRRSFRKGRK